MSGRMLQGFLTSAKHVRQLFMRHAEPIVLWRRAQAVLIKRVCAFEQLAARTLHTTL